MNKHICRYILVVAIAASLNAFAGSASAAGRHHQHHHHRQAATHFSAAIRVGVYAPRVYAPAHHGHYVAPQHGYRHGW